MTSPVCAIGAAGPQEKLAPLTVNRRAPDDDDVVIDIQYCGICQSDIHTVRGEMGPTVGYPMVPGHEIVGVVRSTGKNVSSFKPGDRVGVGCMVDSCRTCRNCSEGEESYCSGNDTVRSAVLTYNGKNPKENFEPTVGGYSESIVVDYRYVLRIPDALPSDSAAPLLCAGITMFSALRHWKTGPDSRVAIIGIGGLGHVGVKLAAAMGAHVTALSHSPGKRELAQSLGAHEYYATSDPSTFSALVDHFNIIINTTSADLQLDGFMRMLRRDGTFVEAGVPEHSLKIHPFSVLFGRHSLAGTMIGGIRETQEMLDFCAEHKITADIEVIPASYINEAYERVLKSDVRFRFVIDMSTIHGNKL
ncbi:GroES-like protein [Schizophyllum commune H4-8]|uniref:Enoyl reductase (ER) domain-containing protein n=1 Tax=Schizophyllum commune (strain H4-8 / FGSC 9210) TaxID=578458 RepID=D8QAK4_SCHCM|nr:GroES-like protein [Schizophyllum commune H4-8]KAI5889954.1 GroES-like protein [Schizophyllum commune H4-8]